MGFCFKSDVQGFCWCVWVILDVNGDHTIQSHQALMMNRIRFKDNGKVYEVKILLYVRRGFWLVVGAYDDKMDVDDE